MGLPRLCAPMGLPSPHLHQHQPPLRLRVPMGLVRAAGAFGLGDERFRSAARRRGRLPVRSPLLARRVEMPLQRHLWCARRRLVEAARNNADLSRVRLVADCDAERKRQIFQRKTCGWDERPVEEHLNLTTLARGVKGKKKKWSHVGAVHATIFLAMHSCRKRWDVESFGTVDATALEGVMCALLHTVRTDAQCALAWADMTAVCGHNEEQQEAGGSS